MYIFLKCSSCCCSAAKLCLTLVTPWTAACQASMPLTISWSLPKFMSIASVMPSNHFILCRFLLLPSTVPSIRVFSNESVLCIRWPSKYWSFSFSISLSNEYSGLISFRTDWFDLFAVQGTLSIIPLKILLIERLFLSLQTSNYPSP